MLMHHTDAQANGIARPMNMCHVAVDQDLTAIGLDQTVEDIHQRRLARAVLTNQGMNSRPFVRDKI